MPLETKLNDFKLVNSLHQVIYSGHRIWIKLRHNIQVPKISSKSQRDIFIGYQNNGAAPLTAGYLNYTQLQHQFDFFVVGQG